MALLSSLYNNTIGRVFSSSTGFKTTKPVSKKRKLDDDGAGLQDRRRKRDDSPDNGIITKRRRVDADRFAPIVDGQTYESTAIEGVSLSEEPRKNRNLMPPPSLNRHQHRTDKMNYEDDQRMSLETEETSQLSIGSRSQRVNDDTTMSDYDMVKARRHAAATTLPPGSGVWEQGEKDLFYHLSYRGFEPLFPRNWMADFDTLPVSLYLAEDDDQEPLIRVYRRNGEFTAKKELRALLELGKNVRDKKLASPGSKSHDLIELSMKKYMKWCLMDGGIPSGSHRALPVYVIVRQKSNWTMKQGLLELKEKMHQLRARHGRSQNVHVSVERDDMSYHTPDSEGDGTYIADSSEDDLPIIYGAYIAFSTLTIFTLNSRVPKPPGIEEYLNDTRPSPALTESVAGTVAGPIPNLDVANDRASDPRDICTSDFSNSRLDTWNELVIAIFAMHVREEMLVLEQRRKTAYSVGDLYESIEKAAFMNVDDPDA